MSDGSAAMTAFYSGWALPAPDPNQRVGCAVGGADAEPFARAGLPSMKRLQPLLPETRKRNSCKSSSMHKPMAVFAMLAAGSICHHLQSLHKPHSDFVMIWQPFA